MAYPDFFFLMFYFIAACIHVLGWSGLICVTMCRHWSLDYTLHDNVSTGSPLIVWKLGPIKFQNHIICKSLKLQYKYYLHSIILADLQNQYCEAFGVLRHWAPSGMSAGFHGGQAVAKRSQNYSQTFSTSLHSDNQLTFQRDLNANTLQWHCTK